MKCSAIIFAILIAPLFAVADANWVCRTPGPIPFNDSASNKWGYLSQKGIVIPPRFDVAAQFTKAGAIACIEGRCGLLDNKGVFVSGLIDARNTPSALVDGIGPVVKHDPAGDPLAHKWGYADQSGNIVIPYQFSFAHDFEDGIALVGEHDKAFFIDHSGNRVTPEFDSASDFSEGLASVTVAGKAGYIRRDGTFALPPVYRGASGSAFSEGLVAVRAGSKVGFMDKTGEIVIKPAYDDAYPFSDGFAPVEIGGKWGYIDKVGNLVIPVQFHTGHMFSEGVASVELDGKWGYIDGSGEFVLPPIYDSAMPFCGGVAQVETFQIIGQDQSRGCRAGMMKGKRGFIDHSGRYVVRDAEERTWKSPFCF